MSLDEKIDSSIRYWNRVWDDPLQQVRADAFIEAWEAVKEWMKEEKEEV